MGRRLQDLGKKGLQKGLRRIGSSREEGLEVVSEVPGSVATARESPHREWRLPVWWLRA